MLAVHKYLSRRCIITCFIESAVCHVDHPISTEWSPSKSTIFLIEPRQMYCEESLNDMAKLVMHTFLVIGQPESLVGLDLSDSRINEMHQMQSKAWMDMKWTDENYALTMPGMNAQQQDPEIQDAAHDLDPEIDDDQDHVIVEDLDHDRAEEVDDHEVVQEDGVETEEVDPSQIDLAHVTENQNLDRLSVTEVDHVTSPAHDLVQDKT